MFHFIFFKNFVIILKESKKTENETNGSKQMKQVQTQNNKIKVNKKELENWEDRNDKKGCNFS